MRLTRTTAWVGGAVLLALVLTAVTWLLLVSPRLQAAADLRDQSASASAQNELLEARVRQLEMGVGELPQTRADVAALREQVPVDADLATLLRQVTDLAARSGATLTGVTPTEPAAEPAPAAPVAPVEGGDPAAPVEGGAPAAPPAPAAPAVQVVPVTLTATGTFVQTQELLRLVQVDLPRALLVRGVALSGGGEGAGGDTGSGDEAGALTLTLTAEVFVLPPTPQEEQLAAVVAEGAPAGSAESTDPSTPGPTPGPTPGAPVPAPDAAPAPSPTAAPLAAAPPSPEETL